MNTKLINDLNKKAMQVTFDKEDFNDPANDVDKMYIPQLYLESIVEQVVIKCADIVNDLQRAESKEIAFKLLEEFKL
jgi:uncharacterized protein with PhoU and TrkA domain